MKAVPQFVVWSSLSLAVVFGAAGCHGNPANTNADQSQTLTQDPAAANVAPVSDAQGVPAGPDYSQNQAPPQNAPQYQNQPQSQNQPQYQDQPQYENAPSSSQYPPPQRRRSRTYPSDRYSSDQYPPDQYAS